MKHYELHHLATIFPEMLEVTLDANGNPTEGDLPKLRESIKTNGFDPSFPITLHEGKILDGRHRYKICKEEGIEGVFTTLPDGVAPAGFVLSANLARRHLNESQRAMLAAKLTQTKEGSNQHTEKVVTQTEAATLTNTSSRSVRKAQRVQEKASPALVAHVESGIITVDDAYGCLLYTSPSPRDS